MAGATAADLVIRSIVPHPLGRALLRIRRNWFAHFCQSAASWLALLLV